MPVLRFIGRHVVGIIGTLFSLLLLAVIVGALWMLTITGVLDVQPFRWLFIGDGGEPVRADVAAVAAVEAKLDEATQGKNAFEVTLDNGELTALLIDTLPANTPIQEVAVKVTPDEVRFDGTLRGRGGVSFDGAVGVALDAGIIKLETHGFSVGVLSLPGATKNLVDQVAEEIVNINDALERPGTSGVLVQGVVLTDGEITISGTQTGGDLITSESLLSALKEGAPGGDLPPERLPEGRVDAKEAPGAPLYVALGDSLANGDRASSQANAYVSRFHRALEDRAGKQLGLRNLGVSGETSAGLISQGQLDQALEIIKAGGVEFITVDIGGNDLLGHLASDECQTDFKGASCQVRVANTEKAYRENIDRIFKALRDAAGAQTTILFLDTYNPFNVGFQSLATTNEAVESLNTIAAEAAAKHNVKVADGFGAIGDKAGGLTYVFEGDIHPNDLGYDQLAYALVQALG